MTEQEKRIFPPRKEIIQIYAILTLLVYSWTVLLIIYDIPRLMLFLTPWDLISTFSYSMLMAFFDSIIFIVIVLLLSLALSRRFLGENYVPVIGGIAISSYAWICFIRFLYMIDLRTGTGWTDNQFVPLLLIALASTSLVGLLVPRIKFLKNLIAALSERSVVFIYIYLPLSAISLLIILFNNL